MKHVVKRLLNAVGFDTLRQVLRLQKPHRQLPDDLDETARAIITRVQPFTMTSTAKLVALIEAVRYVVRNRIPGDIAECGVWRGGSMMAVALTLGAEGDSSRRLYLYDTFQGMTEPTERDRRFDDKPAVPVWQSKRNSQGWCKASLEDVQSNMASTNYPRSQIEYVPGKVEETIPGTTPQSLALLRLDTDWYESTRHELQHLYPLLANNGILILDDYGYWQGARQATDEYFTTSRPMPFLHRVDHSGRLIVKTEPDSHLPLLRGA